MSAGLSAPCIIMPWCQPFAPIAAATAPTPPTRAAPAKNAKTVCRLKSVRKTERGEEAGSGVLIVSPFGGCCRTAKHSAPRSLAVFVGRVKIYEADLDFTGAREIGRSRNRHCDLG